MKFSERLAALKACPEAREWVGKKTLAAAWKTCPRGDWMIWLSAKAGVDRRLIVEAACRCAESALGLVSEGDERPINAIATARRWICGEATLDEVRIAADAAPGSSAAAYAAYAAYAVNISYVAAYSCYLTAHAVNASASAADADAAAAVTADLVRQVVSSADVATALETL